jgi:hypothetical protein
MKPFKTPIHLSIILCSALALATAPSASPAPRPLLQLQPIVVAAGTATVSGSVASTAAGTTVTVNGQPLGLDVSGLFSGVVQLGGASSITLALTEPGSAQQIAYQIPLTGSLLGLGGVIPGTVLDSLKQAGVSLLAPVAAAAGQPLTVAGSVLDKNQLASLSLNGTEILGLVTPGGTFSLQLPGTTTFVTLTATDRNGNSQQTTTPVPQAAPATAVGAAGAVGLRITKVRFFKNGVLRTHRLRMVVTVKDRLGRVVRGAKISVRSTRARRLARQPRTKASGPKGNAIFVLSLRRAAYGKRLVVRTVAKTPQAKASRKTSVAVPRRRSGAHR